LTTVGAVVRIIIIIIFMVAVSQYDLGDLHFHLYFHKNDSDEFSLKI